MKNILLVCLALLFVSGCVSASYNPETGLVSWFRLGGNELGGVEVILADGTSITFEKQKSEAAALLELVKRLLPEYEARIGNTE